MNNPTLRRIAIIAGIVLFVPAFVISPAFGVVFAVILILGFITAQRMLGASEVSMKKRNVNDVLDRMWIPVRDELSEVVRTGGRVTSATSVWTGVPNLYKQEAPTTFHQGMERYVNMRAQVAALVASVTATEESRRRQALEQQQFLFMSRELLGEAKKAIYFIPGSETAVRRAEAARPRPSVQQTKPAATGSRIGTPQPSAAYGSAQAQTTTPARTVQPRPTPSRPAPAPMRSAVETPTKPIPPRPPSRPAPMPTPLRITETPPPPEPPVAPPAPPEPEPPPPLAPPPAVALEAAPETEVAEEIKPPEPAAPVSVPEPIPAPPASTEPEPATPPSAPPGDLQLDVASVCEELFNPKMMSYQANRLFDERYKDATVRWSGTVRRASTYSYDFNFGDGDGTKAEVDIYEVKQQYGSRAVKAFVQLPIEAADDIGARIGEDMRFEGRLLTCEGSARRLYVADAHILD